MPSPIECEFHEAMASIYLRSREEVGYNATRFLRMLAEHEGLETARILIGANTVSEGYVALQQSGHLDLTVEALVLDP